MLPGHRQLRREKRADHGQAQLPRPLHCAIHDAKIIPTSGQDHNPTQQKSAWGANSATPLNREQPIRGSFGGQASALPRGRRRHNEFAPGTQLPTGGGAPPSLDRAVEIRGVLRLFGTPSAATIQIFAGANFLNFAALGIRAPTRDAISLVKSIFLLVLKTQRTRMENNHLVTIRKSTRGDLDLGFGAG